MIEYAAYAECRTWYVVFDKPRERQWRWFRIFTGRRFSHCYALSEAGGGTMRVEPLAWGLCCTWVETEIATTLLDYAQADTTAILSVTVDYRLAQDDVYRGVFTCVSALKALLGLRKCPFTVTPFQLYKRLCKHNGCIAIKPYIPYIGGAYG